VTTEKDLKNKKTTIENDKTYARRGKESTGRELSKINVRASPETQGENRK